jgi:tRNA 2-thiouridine synthesizing protein B
VLHIVNKSPLENTALESCLNLAGAGDVLLIEDAVYAATVGNSFEPTLRAALGKVKIYALQPDLDARGMGDRLVAGVTAVDYSGFVDLTTSNKNCQSWL